METQQTTDVRIVQNPLSASIVERIAAHFIGMFVMVIPLTIAMSIMIATTSDDGEMSAGAVIAVAAILLLVLAFNLFLIITRAQTLGMYLLNLQAVDAVTGRPLSAVKYIFLRGIVGQFLLAMVPFYQWVDLLFIFGQKRQTLHDMLAGSIVVRMDADFVSSLKASEKASPARNIEYQLGDLQYVPPTRMSIGFVVATGVLFIIIPILVAIILVAINPAERLQDTSGASGASKVLTY